MHFFDREINGRKIRVVAESVWDPVAKRSVARQVNLGLVAATDPVDLSQARAQEQRAVGSVGALVWVAEKLEVVKRLNEGCGDVGAQGGPTVGEMVLAVALQRVCEPGSKSELSAFLEQSLARPSCLAPSKYTVQAFHRLASLVELDALDRAQLGIAKAAVAQFKLSADVLAFDSTNFDTHIATTTHSELARRGHAKSKRSDLRVVGLGILASETGQVPLFHRAYAGNASDQCLLADCLSQLGQLHDALDSAEDRRQPALRTLVRDGGFWSEQLELELDFEGYCSLISMPTSHRMAQVVLKEAAQRGAMKALSGSLKDVRAFRKHVQFTTKDNMTLERTLVVYESQQLLDGQKRGIAAALKKAQLELKALERRVKDGKVTQSRLAQRVIQVLRREHLSSFVVTTIGGTQRQPTFSWEIDPKARRKFENTQLGKRVLCTDRHVWSTEKILSAFRSQWNVEELFRRAKGGGIAPWGPSFLRADSSLRLHTFACVLGLTLVSLARVALGSDLPIAAVMSRLSAIKATELSVPPKGRGRPTIHLLAPVVDALQVEAIRIFELERWMPALASCRKPRRNAPKLEECA